MARRNRWGLPACLVVLALAASISACGGGGGGSGSGSGTGGSGGSGGGSGGAGGSGGGSGGGMAGPACSAEQQAALLASWPWFGFEDPTPDLTNGAPAMVTAVDMAGMDLTFEPSGMAARFAWAGPSLAEVFSAGDPVTATSEGFSFRVSGTKGQAVVLRFAGGDKPAALPAIPGGGPSLDYSVECAYEQQKTCPTPEILTSYAITASIGDDGGLIAAGKTLQVGSWKIYHPKTSFVELYKEPDCFPEKFFDGMVQALEVKP
jgi:hypothetical protein